MPLLSLHLPSLPDEQTRKKLLADMTDTLAKYTGKPRDYVMVSLSAAAMMFGGKTAPCAFADVRSIGGLSRDINKNISSEICFLLEQRLSIPKDRVYIAFTDADGGNWGWNGGTFG